MQRLKKKIRAFQKRMESKDQADRSYEVRERERERESERRRERDREREKEREREMNR